MALLQFSEGKVAPPGAKIVYIDGAFDLFHPGHVEALKVSATPCDFSQWCFVCNPLNLAQPVPPLQSCVLLGAHDRDCASPRISLFLNATPRSPEGFRRLLPQLQETL